MIKGEEIKFDICLMNISDIFSLQDLQENIPNIIKNKKKNYLESNSVLEISTIFFHRLPKKFNNDLQRI